MFRLPNSPPSMMNQPYRPPPIQQRISPSNPTTQNGLKSMLSRFTSKSVGSGGGGAKLTNTLSNVQQVLNVAQQATPLIKEYGPMIKNAPKYISMIKALREINKEDDEETVESPPENITEENENISENVIEKQEEQPVTFNESQPKLFI